MPDDPLVGGRALEHMRGGYAQPGPACGTELFAGAAARPCLLLHAALPTVSPVPASETLEGPSDDSGSDVAKPQAPPVARARRCAQAGVPGRIRRRTDARPWTGPPRPDHSGGCDRRGIAEAYRAPLRTRALPFRGAHRASGLGAARAGERPSGPVPSRGLTKSLSNRAPGRTPRRHALDAFPRGRLKSALDHGRGPLAAPTRLTFSRRNAEHDA